MHMKSDWEIQWTDNWFGHMHGHETPHLILKELAIPKKIKMEIYKKS